MYKEIQNLKKLITTEFAGAVKEGKSYHLTPSPSPDRGEGRKITSPHPQPSAWFLLINARAMASPLTPALRQKSASLTKFRNCVAHSYGFTLAETLITVVILGILAAILVPNLIKNQVENANRTKVKKAMAAYEKAINFMIVENDIKSTEALRELGQDNCQYTREYFKTVQDGENNCIFKTADRVWWDITDITNPILILKDSQLGKSITELQILAKEITDNTVYAMIGRFDEVGTLRINDNAFEQGQNNNLDNQKYMNKLWYFVTKSDSILGEFDKCKVKNQSVCKITVNGVETTYNKVTIGTYSYGNGGLTCYNYQTGRGYRCSSTTTPGVYYVEKPDVSRANLRTYDDAKSRCENQGARLANMAELKEMWNSGALSCQNYWIWADDMSPIHAYAINCGLNAREGKTKERPDFFSICISQ